jgi:hypothetical protein
MRTHHQRRFFYVGTIGLLIMYAGAIILLILSFGGCAIMSGCSKIRHDRGSYFSPRPAATANELTGSAASLRATRQEDRVKASSALGKADGRRHA